MPVLTRVFLFSAFAWLLVSLGFETAEKAAAAGWISFHAGSRITALHGIVFGWITQMIFGVAWWMFPPASRETARPRSSLAWMCYAAANAGLLLRFVFEPGQGNLRGELLALSALLQTGAFLCFFAAIFPRIKAR